MFAKKLTKDQRFERAMSGSSINLLDSSSPQVAKAKSGTESDVDSESVYSTTKSEADSATKSGIQI